MTSEAVMHLGKKGLTTEFLSELRKRFEKANTKNIKVRVLKSCRNSRKDVKKYSEEIISYLGDKFNCRIIGFSIFIKKYRKNQR